MTVVRRSIAPGSFGKEAWQCEITSSGLLSLFATMTASGPLWLLMYRSTVWIPFSCCRIPMRFFRAFRHRRRRYLRAIVQQLLGEDGYRNLALYRHSHFPPRAFWHTSIYVRADRGINTWRRVADRARVATVGVVCKSSPMYDRARMAGH